jgi:hypothetical protein
MNKFIPQSHPCRDVLQIVGTDYVLLPDNRIARLITKSTKSGKDYVALYVDKKRGDYSLESVVAATVAGKPLGSAKSKS